jgi:hypothetical protein
MTKEEFRGLKSLEDRRVHMTFTDGQQVIATLITVQTDMDESQHLIYDRVEWDSSPGNRIDATTFYAPGESLVSCSLA